MYLKSLCIKLVIGWGYTKMHCQRNIKKKNHYVRRTFSTQWVWMVGMTAVLYSPTLPAVVLSLAHPGVHQGTRSACLFSERYHEIITTSVCVNSLAGWLEENTGKCAGGGSGNSWREMRMVWIHRTLVASVLLTLRRLMSYIYGSPILDVSRSHTTTQHSR